MHASIHPTFSSVRLSVPGFILRFLIHLDWHFVCGDRYGSICILLHVDIQLCQYHLLKMFSFSMYNFNFFVKTQVFVCVWINQIFNWIPLVHLSVFMPVSSCFHYYSSIVELEVRDGDPSGSSFIVQDRFGYPGFFDFAYEVEYCSFEVCEELC